MVSKLLSKKLVFKIPDLLPSKFVLTLLSKLMFGFLNLKSKFESVVFKSFDQLNIYLVSKILPTIFNFFWLVFWLVLYSNFKTGEIAITSFCEFL